GRPWPRTTHASRAPPRLWPTMHRPGVPWPDEPHTVSGGAGGPPAGRADPVVEDDGVRLGELEPLSAAPRMTPTTTRAAPTEAQPAQAMCSRSQRRQREPRLPAGAPDGVRPGPGLRRGAGL